MGALLAVVAAEAEPWYGLGYGYGLLHKPVITSIGGLTTYSNGAVVPTNTPAVAAATANHLATKFGVYAPLTHPVTSVGGLTTYANGAVVPTDFNNLAATHAHLASKGLHLLGKREAEAEPWYGLYGRYGYGGY